MDRTYPRPHSVTHTPHNTPHTPPTPHPQRKELRSQCASLGLTQHGNKEALRSRLLQDTATSTTSSSSSRWLVFAWSTFGRARLRFGAVWARATCGRLSLTPLTHSRGRKRKKPQQERVVELAPDALQVSPHLSHTPSHLSHPSHHPTHLSHPTHLLHPTHPPHPTQTGCPPDNGH
jgi:hypothetical protein